MKISHNWLQEFVDIRLTPSELSDALNMLGIEVESFEDRRSMYDGFVVARVETKEKHPKADKLSVCTVFDGTDTRTVVCGATNVDAGQTIVLAKPGSTVPRDGFQIGVRALRGVESHGMICSKAELMLPEDIDGIWVLDPSLPLGAPAGEALGLSDVIYEMSITPNRADALSHLGIARVIAAYQGTDIRMPVPTVRENSSEIANANTDTNANAKANAKAAVTVQVNDAAACPRYLAREVRSVFAGPSPLWLQQRLESVGLRPRNVIVDITNFVLMECGHPLHAFDADVVHHGGIVVEPASEGERFVTLDGKERILDANMLMIRDSEKSLAVAGVMGGQNSAITEHTKNVLIESAYFAPSSIRRTARRLGISSDASYRFERGTDINVLEYAVNRAAQLMQQLAGGEPGSCTTDGFSEVYPRPVAKKIIPLRFERVRSVLGIDLSNDVILERLSRLDCAITEQSADAVHIEAPSYRVDLNEEIDVIEDIAIIGHYDSIPVAAETIDVSGTEAFPAQFVEAGMKKRIRTILSMSGLHEIVTQNQTDPQSDALCGGGGIVLQNPLGEELSVMRSSLVPSIMRVVAYNVRQGSDRIALFEIGKTFSASSNAASAVSGITESEHICLAFCGSAHPQTWHAQERSMDYFDCKGVVQSLLRHLGMSAEFGDSSDALFTGDQSSIVCNGVQIGVMGAVSKDLLKHADCPRPVYVAVVHADTLSQIQTAPKKFERISPFPTVQRDLAFVVADGVPSESLRACIERSCGAILQSARLFDVFSHASLGAGKKSCAYRLVFGSGERTLTDADVDPLIQQAIATVSAEFEGVLRA